jgi:hypothetical protein
MYVMTQVDGDSVNQGETYPYKDRSEDIHFPYSLRNVWVEEW